MMTSKRKKAQKVIDSRQRIFYGSGVPANVPEIPPQRVFRKDFPGPSDHS
jgi:hypothetical protein